jgi:enoyl-CoA hydratase
MELIMTGRTIGAEEALRIGLINRIADGDVLEAATGFAAEFTQYGLPALAFARSAVRRALDTPLPEGLRIEADLSTLAYRTEDAAEGIAAFVDKRPPVFQDR